MIGYITLGTNDILRAAKFYDELLAGMGAKRAMESDRFIAWSNGSGPMLCVIKPFNEQASSGGNGTMVALAPGSTDKVDELHKKALSLGAKDEGAPGPRGDGGFYAGYLRDLDGNKLAFFNM